ncbi:ScyD/ScyE family protein [Georgenia sp. M64]|uniref:ScyD/ScyE family protein n=1 Tax=Georgenia sp. M64 TaxID=3120520 RepID=UPI0030DF819A
MGWKAARTGIALAGGLVMAGVAVAPATGDAHYDTIVSGLAGPSGLSVGSDGSIYVAQMFGGALSEVSSGEIVDLAHPAAGMLITGVDARGRGTLTYLESGGGMGTTDGFVYRLLPNGRTRLLADLGTYEDNHNPDQGNTYGLVGLPEGCTVPEFLLPYDGGLDSNVYSVTILDDGSRVVADAGGNDLLRVRPNGGVETLAVLPPIALTVDQTVIDVAMADFGADISCAEGATLNLEPVPTDVEVGPDGMLYVTSLPGGPESDALGANGSVFRVDPATGDVELVATGFLGATDLAVAPDGTIYVTELFGGRISMADGDTPVEVLAVGGPNAVEYHDGALYAAVGFGFGPPTGSVITFVP